MMKINRRYLLNAGSSLLAFAALAQRAQRAVGLTGAASMTNLMASRSPANAANAHRILLINPNSNQATTDMMVQIAQSAASDDIKIVGATAPHSPPMIVDPEA
jgi:hypothetical protein